ncbi:TPA: hypothetical protein N0F65_008738 [Lagenidium giganteum]|uniref:WD repeat protein mio zinc-ribbon like domain-containing protein n=1 Tax=Lagenidium giganteum TaxID=4803 RepID=A0AAV2YZU6_9STRA|nr:TPA: hypothetical protein N0F65_008738 [Lagenidium giganteum]
MSKQRMVVEWSPHDASLFAVGADNLRLFETTCTSHTSGANGDLDPSMTTQRKRSFRLIKINSQVAQLKCMEWYPFDAKPMLIAAGTGSGKVTLSDFQETRTRVVREFLPKYSRPCNAVAWNNALPNQIAAGFEKVRSDFCTLVWDINASAGASTISGAALDGHHDDDADNNGGNSMMLGVGSHHRKGQLVPNSNARSFSRENDKPMHELSNSEATVALSWVPLQPTCLAAGTGFKWLRIYDLRTKATAPMSVVAHNKAVLGVVFDHHRPHILATYTDGPQEPVKIWDIRHLDSPVGPLASLHPTSKSLSQVSWCPSKPGILVTASTEDKWVSLWDVAQQEGANATDLGTAATTTQIKKPFKRRYTSDPLTSFSWQYVNPSVQAPFRDVNASVAAAAFPNRLLTASTNGEIEDISVHDSMPISVSSHGAVAFSCGKLLFGGGIDSTPASGRSHSHSSGTGATATTGDTDGDSDVSGEMYKLAKQGYSVVLAKCLKIFANPSTARARQLRGLWQWVDQVEALRRNQATRIAHARGMTGSGAGGVNAVAPGPLRGWPVEPTVLVLAGVKNLLQASADNTGGPTATLPVIVSNVRTDPALGCQFYDGLGRRLALLACNWDPDCGQGFHVASAASGLGDAPPAGPRSGHTLHRSSSGAWSSQKQFEESAGIGNRSLTESNRHELRSIINKCETEGNYPRAAALAVFHGDLQAGVAVLQRGASWMAQMQAMGVPIPFPVSPDVLQLVAMAIAGYSSASMGAGGMNLWATMCQQLLRRDEIVGQNQPRYLHALLSFLCVANTSSSLGLSSSRPNPPPPRRGARRSWGSVDGLSVFTGGSKQPTSGLFATILNDATLPLTDRVAFGCRFLPADDLRLFVQQYTDECEHYGKLEGLVLTGMDDTGIKLLQKHLDMTGDIQTLALLAARLPSSHVEQSPSLKRWIMVYQDLLNQWQLFHERARFDVGRSQLEDVLNNFANFARDPDGEELQAELSAPSSLSVPPQLYVRCNFCNASLSLANLLRLGGSHSSWLNRAKPKLTCCPSCRKPLPQCALCLLPFGSLNPYFELAHRRSKQSADTVATAMASNNNVDHAGLLQDAEIGSGNEHENLAQLSSIPFVEWFTWCQSCKHGGHAHHLADWFELHSVCPVTDCDCTCQQLDQPLITSKQQKDKQANARSDHFGASGSIPLAMPTVGSKTNLAGGTMKRSGSKLLQQHLHSSSSSSLLSAPPQIPQPPSSTGSTGLRSSSAFRVAPPALRVGGGANMFTPASSVASNSSSNLAALAALDNTNALSSKLDQLEKDKNAFKFM